MVDGTTDRGSMGAGPAGDKRPILIVPYMWLGDFVRCHSVVKLLQARWPQRPVDILTSALAAPILDYMPGVRKGIVCDLPRGRLALRRNWALAQRLRTENYGTALVLPRTWKSALAPFLAGIPQRTGFFGEGRFILLNDIRWGERSLERMIDCFGTLALPPGAQQAGEWPLPGLRVPQTEIAAWRERQGLATTGPVIAFAPGAVGPGKAWPPAHYAALAKKLTADGCTIWVLGGPAEKTLATEIVTAGDASVRDLTGTDLRNAILALAACDAAVTNDSGLMHIAAGIDTPTIAIFGPTAPRLWAPLNPLAAILEPPGETPPDIKLRRTADVSVDRVYEAVRGTLAARSQTPR